jgi:hypothetical protein
MSIINACPYRTVENLYKRWKYAFHTANGTHHEKKTNWWQTGKNHPQYLSNTRLKEGLSEDTFFEYVLLL